MSAIYNITEDLDKKYAKMSRKAKFWSLMAIIAVFLLLIVTAGMAIYFHYQRNSIAEYYKAELDKSKQNYYIQSVSNSNLDKKLQDLMLELARLRNHTVSIETMIAMLKEDSVNIHEVHKRLMAGVDQAKRDLNKMGASVTEVINSHYKSFKLNTRILDERCDTLGKNAVIPGRW